jgi:L-ascorbate metabolism protein UlaG (beta-lactamase superfamily)
MEVAGWRILTDPTFDPAGRRYGFGLGTSSTKTVGPAVSPADLGPIDLVLLSHEHHADNLDDLGLQVSGTAAHVLPTTGGARRLARQVGCVDVRGMRAWDTQVLEEPGLSSLSVTATPCRHGPPLSSAVGRRRRRRSVTRSVTRWVTRWARRNPQPPPG